MRYLFVMFLYGLSIGAAFVMYGFVPAALLFFGFLTLVVKAVYE